jgi:hypothetical protein
MNGPEAQKRFNQGLEIFSKARSIACLTSSIYELSTGNIKQKKKKKAHTMKKCKAAPVLLSDLLFLSV